MSHECESCGYKNLETQSNQSLLKKLNLDLWLSVT
jgi:hypothetical protein